MSSFLGLVLQSSEIMNTVGKCVLLVLCEDKEHSSVSVLLVLSYKLMSTSCSCSLKGKEGLPS